MKRFFATTAIVTLMLTAFAGCSKDKEKDNNTGSTPIPSISAPQNDSKAPEGEVGLVAFGGYFTSKDANLTIYLSDGGWKVNGMLSSDEDNTSPLVMSVPLTYTEGANLVYEGNGEKLTFSFAKDSLTVTANSGNTYAAFAGEYKRVEEASNSGTGTVTPERGSTLELLGRIATAYFVVTNNNTTDFSLDLSATTFGNDFLCSFLVAYTDLFLANSATVYPEISTEYLYYAFSKADLDNVLLAATAGSYDASKLSTEGSDIVLADGVYYVPCRGEYAGGLTGNAADANQDAISENLFLEATIARKGGSRETITMTLSTSENANAGTAGIQIDTVTYEVAK